MAGERAGFLRIMAAAMRLVQGAPYVDLDAPLLLAEDRWGPMQTDGATLYPAAPALWG